MRDDPAAYAADENDDTTPRRANPVTVARSLLADAEGDLDRHRDAIDAVLIRLHGYDVPQQLARELRTIIRSHLSTAN